MDDAATPSGSGTPEPRGAPPLRIGVLASQGDFAAHAEVLRSLGADPVEVRTPHQLRDLDGLVIPGGESTTISRAIERDELEPAIRTHAVEGRPVLGTCAGMILCDRNHRGPRAGRRDGAHQAAGTGRPPVKDPRVEALARILVRYSTEVREGETCVIEGSTAGEPLIAAVYEEVLAAGGLPVMSISVQGQLPIF